MSETKSTPGPWRHGFDDGSGMESVVTAALTNDGLPVRVTARVRWGCSCCEPTGPMSAEETANARLIAAAPDMLEALRSIIAWQDEYLDETRAGFTAEQRDALIRNAARAAIQKAEGKS